ncbi:glycoside hydrolase family 16 protein [Rhodococcus sp. IEGM 1307]|uniref:glycoside hydrolase family 16 protein n=1 Tax=Rhodococcus sp. IEGM 1307 TaxID=3047091 RepID=UPI0024B7FE36|nr:glycoside hydrolase family 16 protein [Rhodococcus sp. IEGM 1307]MDI9973378.1 glycoside hydrolase family 16 protein [Rhodococcus sp. IEGM 1307]
MQRMRSALVEIALTCSVALCALSLTPAAAAAAPGGGGVRTAYPGYTVIGSDEFDGPANAAPNPLFWGYDLGGGGWGNNEKQVYTDSRQNSRLDGNGRLVVEARRNGGGFTSARLVTRGKFEFTYGVIEARIQVPSGPGIHPAFWTLGSNITSVGWPACGEIDILEVVGDGSRYHAGVHGPTVGGGHWERSTDGSIGANLSAGFHDYALIKAPGRISVGIDGNIVGTVTTADLRPEERWVFDSPAYLLLDVAVGGNWPGPVTSSTRFPATMLVDWVRFSQ